MPVKRVLVHEGIVDTVVPNETTENLARAADLPDVKATDGCQDDGRLQRDLALRHGRLRLLGDVNGHLVTFLVPQAARQAKRVSRVGRHGDHRRRSP